MDLKNFTARVQARLRRSIANRLEALDRGYLRWRSSRLMFGDFNRPLRANRVNVYYWRPAVSDNVGDLISLVLVRSVAESLGLDFDRKLPQTRKLFAVGSVLEMAVAGATVWGSGLRHPILAPHGLALDIRAVRGPLTRQALAHIGYACPEVYGDPAVLLPRFYAPRPVPRRRFLVVPHFLKERDLLARHPGNAVSTLTSDWRGFVDAIAGADLVVSGSLHGIVLAEAYGVPAILLAGAMDQERFKYDDYYLGTGRARYDVAHTVEEALALGGQPLPALGPIQDGLMDAFPADLWKP
ncbi:MAG TPA: polysaccharide pyruvyl transferase family protein [Ramlibacter sp.]|nr:polysaccharide pyruvyl transferase family protein [Ramlibacter sp.]